MGVSERTEYAKSWSGKLLDIDSAPITVTSLTGGPPMKFESENE
jgi:hypothetical protein